MDLNCTKQLLIFRYYTKVIVSVIVFEIAINIDFSKFVGDLQRICMESLDLPYKLVELKIINKSPVQIYFMSQLFQELGLPPLPPQAGGGGGGVVATPPSPPNFFSWQNFFFHRYMGIWKKGG